MNFKHKIFVFLFALFLAPSVFAEELSVVANVNIFEAKIVSVQENNYNVSFKIINGLGSQPDVRYSVRLTQDKDSSQYIIDEKIYSEILSLNENSVVERNIKYQAPNIFSGDYKMWLIGSNSSGRMLGAAFLGKVNLKASAQSVQILPESCYLTVSGEKEGLRYTLDQGVDILPTENLSISCGVINNSQKTITAVPQFQTYRRNVYGEKVSENSLDIVTTLKPSENKSVTFVLPVEKIPQAYDIKLNLNDKANNISSNSIIIHYVLRGGSATIQNVVIDKDKYKKGDIAHVSLSFSESAENFPGSRLGDDKDGKLTADFKLADGNGISCSENIINKLLNDANEKINIPVTKDCLNPKLSAIIKGSDGNILDKKDFSFISTTEIVAPSFNVILILGYLYYLIFAVAFILLVKIVWALIKKYKKTPLNIVIFLVLVSGIFLFSERDVHAVAWDDSGYCGSSSYSGVTGSLNLDKYERKPVCEVIMQSSWGYSLDIGYFLCDDAEEIKNKIMSLNPLNEQYWNSWDMSSFLFQQGKDGFTTAFSANITNTLPPDSVYVRTAIVRRGLFGNISSTEEKYYISGPVGYIYSSSNPIYFPGETITMTSTGSAWAGCGGNNPVTSVTIKASMDGDPSTERTLSGSWNLGEYIAKAPNIAGEHYILVTIHWVEKKGCTFDKIVKVPFIVASLDTVIEGPIRTLNPADSIYRFSTPGYDGLRQYEISCSHSSNSDEAFKRRVIKPYPDATNWSYDSRPYNQSESCGSASQDGTPFYLWGRTCITGGICGNPTSKLLGVVETGIPVAGSCNYSYSDYGACLKYTSEMLKMMKMSYVPPGNYHFRSVISSSPVGCTGSPKELMASCTMNTNVPLQPPISPTLLDRGLRIREGNNTVKIGVVPDDPTNQNYPLKIRIQGVTYEIVWTSDLNAPNASKFIVKDKNGKHALVKTDSLNTSNPPL